MSDGDFNWFNYDEELKLSVRLLAAAKSPSEERRALLKWLKAAAAVVGDNLEGDLNDPAVLLVAALESIEGGITPSLFRPEVVELRSPAWERARARAVVAVDELVKRDYTPKEAIGLVAGWTGMATGALRSLRSSVHAGKRQLRLQRHLERERLVIQQSLEGYRLLRKLRVPEVGLLARILMEDRIIHKRLKKTSHPPVR